MVKDDGSGLRVVSQGMVRRRRDGVTNGWERHKVKFNVDIFLDEKSVGCCEKDVDLAEF